MLTLTQSYALLAALAAVCTIEWAWIIRAMRRQAKRAQIINRLRESWRDQ